MKSFLIPVAAGLFLLALGCEGDGGSLIVDVRTDYVAGVEFTAIEVGIVGGAVQTVAVRREDDLVATPRRAASFTGLAAGPVELFVRLVDPDGEVTTRTVIADVTETFGLTVVLSRSCETATCPLPGDPAATECLGGACVEPQCTDGTQVACATTGLDGCMGPGDCPDASACGRPVCQEGVCFYAVQEIACAGPGEYCDPTFGCREPGAPVFDVVEGLVVSVFDEETVSSTVLEAGVTYRLRASGTWDLGGGEIGDADWYQFAMPQDIGDASIDIGIGIDDDVVDDDTQPDWGPYRDDHIYEIDFVGRGAPITARVHDCCYDNNIGELGLEILAPR